MPSAWSTGSPTAWSAAPTPGSPTTFTPWSAAPDQRTSGAEGSTNRRPNPPDEPPQKRPVRTWLVRRRRALLSSALRSAAYATGAGTVGLAFWLIQQRLQS